MNNASPTQKTASPAATWAAMIIVWVVWGSTYLAIRYAVETIPPFLMAATRMLIAGAILYAWNRLSGNPAPTRRQWRSAAIVGVLLLTLGNGGVSWSEQRVYSAIAALMVGSVPLWVSLLSWFIPRRRAEMRQSGWISIAGVLLGFSGIALLVGPGQLKGAGSGVDLVGAGVLLFASFCWSLGSIYGHDADLPASPLLGTGMEMLAGGVGLLLLGTLTGEWGQFHLTAITARSWWSLAYLVVFGALVGYAAYTWLLRVAPTPLVSTYAYVNPLIAVFLGSLLAQEPLNARVLLSAVVIIGAVALINTSRMTAPQAAEALPSSTGDD
jgi:drug/metabolite transporter (DMT)-like permease